MPNEIIKIKSDNIPDFITELVRDKYMETANRLIDMNILTVLDLPAYNLMFFHYGLCIEAIQKIKQFGAFQKDRHIVRKNPAIQIL